ncbi:MAG: LLM class flavin-dependent oxidoreductase [Beijerinckiaceae bacterium]
MEFGIWSNGFRPHTTAARTFEEDLQEIILADQLGFKYAYISEHHGEEIYIDRVDTLPVPELLMCKAAALTRQIKMGAAVKVIHLQHPLDVAVQAATTQHVIGSDRFIFGFGSGFPTPLFSLERGMSYEERHDRLMESLDLVIKCWSTRDPFDWDGRFWKGKGIVALPKPLTGDTIPMATATEQPEMIRIAGSRGYTLLSAYLEPAHMLRAKADRYSEAARAAGVDNPRANIAASRLVYLSNSRKQAMNDLRADIDNELGYQTKRGLVHYARNVFKLDVKGERLTLDDMVDGGVYLVGEPDEVAERLREFHRDSGGFGALLIVTGKEWADRERRLKSMRLFMEEVAPRLRDLPAHA